MVNIKKDDLKTIVETQVQEQEESSFECPLDHTPNKKTIASIISSRTKKNIIEIESIDEFFKKLGID